MSAIDAWSWSRFETFELCPLQFKLKFIDKLASPGSPAMARGNEVHKATASYLLGQTDALPEAVKLPFHRKLLAECRDMEDKVVEQQWAFNRQWSPTGWFDKAGAKNGAAWLRTIVDYGAVYEDMEVEVIDWKTGKAYGHNAEQVELFGLSVLCHFKPATKVTTRLVYFDAGTEQVDVVEAKDKDKLIAKWTAKVQPMFDEVNFLPRPNDRCRFCDFSRSKGGPCRFG